MAKREETKVGKVHVVDGRPITEHEKCRWCEKPGEYLCDFPVDPKSGKTCDAPMCEDHRTVISSGIMCSRRRGKKGGCRPFSIDHCPDHSSSAVTRGGEVPGHVTGPGPVT